MPKILVAPLDGVYDALHWLTMHASKCLSPLPLSGPSLDGVGQSLPEPLQIYSFAATHHSLCSSGSSLNAEFKVVTKYWKQSLL